MNCKKNLFILIIIIIHIPFSVFAEDIMLIPFKLKDQFGQIHSHNEYLDNLIIVMASDKKGRSFNEIWGPALIDSLKSNTKYDEIIFLAIADGRGVPFFLKKMITGKFPKDRIFLMDWKGLFAKTYNFLPGVVNLQIYMPEGRLIYQTYVSEMDNRKLKDITTIICEELKSQ